MNAMVVYTSTRKVGQNCSDWPDLTDNRASQVLWLKGIRLAAAHLPGSCNIQWSICSWLLPTGSCLSSHHHSQTSMWCPSYGNVCFPIIQDVSGCSQQDLQVPQPDGDLGSSALDVSIVDAGATRVVSQSSHTTGRASTSHSRSLVAQLSHWGKDLLTLKSSCLATLNGLFFKFDYS